MTSSTERAVNTGAVGPDLRGRSLLPNWAAQMNPDASYGGDQFYYYHIHTGETRWEPPFAEAEAEQLRSAVPPPPPARAGGASPPRRAVHVNRSGSISIAPAAGEWQPSPPPSRSSTALVAQPPAASQQQQQQQQQQLALRRPIGTGVAGASTSPLKYVGTDYEGLEWDPVQGTWLVADGGAAATARFPNASQLMLANRAGAVNGAGRKRRTWAEKYAPPRAPVSIFEKLTNPGLYTSTHKHRFKKRGGVWKGRGKNGRDSFPKGRGQNTNQLGARLRVSKTYKGRTNTNTDEVFTSIAQFMCREA